MSSLMKAGRGGFRQLLHSEWTKFTTVRGWVRAMIGAVLVILLVGLVGTAASNQSEHDANPSLPVGPGGGAVNDNFYFVHQPLRGDGSISVSVTSLTGVIATEPKSTKPGVSPWAKAGIIVKDNLEQGSAYAAMMVTGAHGVRMQHNYTEDTAGGTGNVSKQFPRWLRLNRSGDTITGYESADGTKWTELGTARLPGLSSTAEVGLFVTSPSAMEETSTGAGFGPAVATGSFGEVALGGQWNEGSWKDEQVGGDAGTSGSYTQTTKGEYTKSGTSYTLTGAGDIAPVVGGPAMGPGNTIENFLVGAFAGLIVVIVVGTGFITVEYRRGLIAVTLAASPRRGRVLVAKAIVVGSLSFVVGLAAAAVMIPLGENRAHANGFYVLTVPTQTELRVMVGTGLLLAVAGVLALAVGAILRRSAAAITVVVAGMVLPYILATASVLPTGASDWLLRVTPAAGFAIQQSVQHYEHVLTTYTPASGYFPLTPWAGFAVLCAYTGLAFAAAVVLLRRRDA
ncbi:ABC transporter permease subunit [Streptomyces spiramyceticus]|uniref:ABC transporter permease subunit n=1 Tax=Streptomyces spiramyceticus TaxID=299717 RepID=UPI00237BD0DA|nr:ABC transporter permease subunit [Streptomyces spiramyceticus]